MTNAKVIEHNTGDDFKSGDEGEGGKWCRLVQKGLKEEKAAKRVSFIYSGADEPCDKVAGAKEKSIQCKACLEWFHPKCHNLCSKGFRAIQT